MSCSCDKCPKRGTDKCDKERLRWDVQYLRDLLARAEGRRPQERTNPHRIG